jgi:hypothetical protein
LPYLQGTSSFSFPKPKNFSIAFPTIYSRLILELCATFRRDLFSLENRDVSSFKFLLPLFLCVRRSKESIRVGGLVLGSPVGSCRPPAQPRSRRTVLYILSVTEYCHLLSIRWSLLLQWQPGVVSCHGDSWPT